jgi:NAD(P)-dependent dehydrogenase (short-subunit alcohol dehydrogenase family)
LERLRAARDQGRIYHNADLALSVGVNVEAPFRVCRSAIPILAAAGGGAIVNVASCWDFARDRGTPSIA